MLLQDDERAQAGGIFMHSLIDEQVVTTIRTTGNTDANMTDRVEILKKWGLPYDRQAENVIISGCQIPFLIPHVLQQYALILERCGVSYTFLSKEYCCGNYLYRPAIKQRDADALAQCRLLSQEFIGMNLELARALGAKRIAIFCSPCYPIFKHAFPEEEIVFYPKLLDAVARGDRLLCRLLPAPPETRPGPDGLEIDQRRFRQDRGTVRSPDRRSGLLSYGAGPEPHAHECENKAHGPCVQRLLHPSTRKHARGQSGADPVAAGIYLQDQQLEKP
jgi:hypothetical protein